MLWEKPLRCDANVFYYVQLQIIINVFIHGTLYVTHFGWMLDLDVVTVRRTKQCPKHCLNCCDNETNAGLTRQLVCVYLFVIIALSVYDFQQNNCKTL